MKLIDLKKSRVILPSIACISGPFSVLIFELCNLEPNQYLGLIPLIELKCIFEYVEAQKSTYEYKNLNRIYDKIVFNTKNLISLIENDNPVSIFATYNYLYKNGYLSYNKNFNFDDKNVIDMMNLPGIDLFRGKGVCRSISPVLTDIYKKFGYNAKTLLVNCSQIPLKGLLPDHVITLVDDGFNSYKLDPTNELMFQKGDSNNLLAFGEKEQVVRSKMVATMLVNNDINLLTYIKQYNMPDIDLNNYKSIYLRALENCNQSKEIFEHFYYDNAPLYEQVNEITKKVYPASEKIKKLNRFIK